VKTVWGEEDGGERGVCASGGLDRKMPQTKPGNLRKTKDGQKRDPDKGKKKKETMPKDEKSRSAPY